MTWPTTSRAVQPWQGGAADQSLTPSTTDEKSATALRYLSLFVLMGAHSSARAAEPPGSRSSFPDRTEHRLDVEDGCAVDGFEVSHPDPRGLDLHDLDLVQSDRVRPGGRPGVEDTLEGSRGVSPWMHLEHAAVGPIEPSQHDHHVARRQTTHRRAESRIEDEASLGRAFVTLSAGGGRIDQRGLDPADRTHLVALVIDRGHSSLRARRLLSSQAKDYLAASHWLSSIGHILAQARSGD